MQRKNETLLEDNWLGIKKGDPHTKILLLGMVHSCGPIELNTAEDFEKVAYYYDILKQCEGCVPDDHIGEDVSESVAEKFYKYWRAVRSYLQYGLKIEHNIDCVVNPGVMDSTFYLLYDRDTMKVLYTGSDKAWNVYYKDAKELANAIVDDARTLSKNLLKAQTEAAELVSLRLEVKRLRQRE